MVSKPSKREPTLSSSLAVGQRLEDGRHHALEGSPTVVIASNITPNEKPSTFTPGLNNFDQILGTELFQMGQLLRAERDARGLAHRPDLFLRNIFFRSSRLSASLFSEYVRSAFVVCQHVCESK